MAHPLGLLFICVGLLTFQKISLLDFHVIIEI